MKTIISCIIFLLFSASSFAADIKLAWDANTESDLAGYKVYMKEGSNVPPFVKIQDIPKGVIEATVKNLGLISATSFAVTAYNTAGLESGYSNIVTIPAISAKPSGLKWSLILTLAGGQ